MIIEKPKYSFCDLQIMPARISHIRSRKECDATYDGKLPLFTAPMDSVVDDTNYQIYKNAQLNVIIHRNVSLDKRIELTKKGEWCAYSLNEFETLFCDKNSDIYTSRTSNEIRSLIDVANGHMSKIFTLAKSAKNTAEKLNYKLVLMAGNIANPETYEDYCNCGIDYVRCSIGTGAMCLTSANSSVGMSNASLIDDIYKIKQSLITKYKGEKPEDNKYFVYTKIIADGGIKNYSDVIVALACGADYVMIGGIFASFIESCAELNISTGMNDRNKGFLYNHNLESDIYSFSIPRTADAYTEYNAFISKYDLNPAKFTNAPLVYNETYDHMIVILTREQLYIPEVSKWIIKHTHLTKTSHGMSTKEAQIDALKNRGETFNRSKLKTSEGKAIEQEVHYSVYQWTENFKDYLRSAMSYTDHKTLQDFIGNCTLTIKSQGTMMTVNR